MAPVFYLSGNPGVGSSLARQFERDAAKLTAVSPITGNVDQLTVALADPVELKLLHMITADPQRTPTFVMFGNADYYFFTFGPAPFEDSGYAWNHGGIQPEIVKTWLGMVGPGVTQKGMEGEVWSDHTDIRPTVLALVGLQDDYQSQGRVLAEVLDGQALPDGVAHSGAHFLNLARAYKRINAPVGELGLSSLKISTRALAGSDDTYKELEGRLARVTEIRNAIADRMLERLTAAEFARGRISEEDESLVSAANALVDYVNWLANHTGQDE